MNSFPRLERPCRILIGWVCLWLGIVFGAFATVSVAAPQIVTLQGEDTGSFARIVFSFAELPQVELNQTNGILVLKFDRPFAASVEPIENRIPNYVSASRLDPDGKSIRFALVRSVKTNLSEAGDDLYLDLMPAAWKGPPPPLPADVVQRLSRRLRAAEKATKQVSTTHSQIRVDAASSFKFSRLSFRGIDPQSVESSEKLGVLEIRFSGSCDIDLAKVRSELPRGFHAVRTERTDDSLKLWLEFDHALRVSARPEDGAFIVDLHFPGVGSLDLDMVHPAIVTSSIVVERRSDPPVRMAEVEAPAKPVLPEVALNGRSIRLQVDKNADRIRLETDKGAFPPSAIFVRGGYLWIVIQSPLDLDARDTTSAVPASFGPVNLGRREKVVYLRTKLKTPQPPRIMPGDGNALLIDLTGDPGAGPSLQRSVLYGPRNQPGLLVGMAGTGDPVEFEDPVFGDRIFVVPSSALGAGATRALRYQEFSVLDSAQGLAVAAVADDVAVKVESGGVSITRPDGLAISEGDDKASPNAKKSLRLAVNRLQWMHDRGEDAWNERNERLVAIAGLSGEQRKQALLDYSRFLAANGLYREALTSLDVGIDHRSDTELEDIDLLERSVYTALQGDLDDAMAKFSQVRLGGNQEAALWRSYIHASAGRWTDAVKQWQQSGTVFMAYPPQLQALLAMPIAEAAVEAANWPMADDLIRRVDVSADPALRDRAMYLKARKVEADGDPAEALAILDRAMSSLDLRTAVRAQNIHAEFEMKTGAWDRERGLQEFQLLASYWRGDFIEARVLKNIARACIDLVHWRCAFESAQRLNRNFAELDGVRPILDEIAVRLESLLERSEPGGRDAMNAVALFFEFREFMPAGRRGDELGDDLFCGLSARLDSRSSC